MGQHYCNNIIRLIYFSALISFISQDLVRKRRPRPTEWKANIRKAKRNRGEAYKQCNGNIAPARSMGPPCSRFCHLGCKYRFDHDQRKQMFDEYWALASFERQRDFIRHYVNEYHKPQQKKKIKESSNITKHIPLRWGASMFDFLCEHTWYR